MQSLHPFLTSIPRVSFVCLLEDSWYDADPEGFYAMSSDLRI